MKLQTVASVLRCPDHPGATLDLSDAEYAPDSGTQAQEVVSGTLRCPECAATYPIRDGIAYLVPLDLAPSTELEMHARDHDAPVYADTKTSYENRVEARFLLSGLGIREGGVIIDLGAGDGRYTHSLARTPAGRVLAVDISPEMLALNRRKAEQTLPREVREKIDYLVADANHLPFANNSADLVLSAQMIEHLQPEDHVRCLCEIRRVVRPDGQMRMTSYHMRVTSADILAACRNPSDAAALLRGKYPAEKRHTRRTGYVGPNHDLFFYSQTDLEFRALLEDAGFEVNTLTGILNLPGPTWRLGDRLDAFVGKYMKVWSRQRGHFLGATAHPRGARAGASRA